MDQDDRLEVKAARKGEFRRYTYHRPAILLLLREHESHGYELFGRLAELGFDSRDSASLYGVLRDMEKVGLIGSSWNMSQSGGPPRRIYATTALGDQYLRDSEALLVKQRDALNVMLDRYRAVSKRRRRRPAVASG